MNDFELISTERGFGKHVVAVVARPRVRTTWSDEDVMGHDCTSVAEFDELIERLKNSLESVRRRGHAKLSDRSKEISAG